MRREHHPTLHAPPNAPLARPARRQHRPGTPRGATLDPSPEGRLSVHGTPHPLALMLLLVTLAVITSTAVAMAAIVSVWSGALFLVLGVIFAILANPVAWATLLRLRDQP